MEKGEAVENSSTKSWEVCEAFIATLHPGSEGWTEITLIREEPRKVEVLWAPCSDVQERGRILREALARNEAGWHAYAGISPRRERKREGRRGTAADALSVPALWVDVDDPAGLDALMAMAPPPSAIFGSGGGWHAYWFLQEAVAPTNEVKRILQGLADACGGDRAVCEFARVMRLPMTINHKPERDGARGEVMVWEPELRYALSDFAAYEVHPPKSVPRTALPPGQKLGLAPWMEDILNRDPGDGERNPAAYRLAAALKDQGWNESEVVELLLSRGYAGWTVDKASEVVHNAFKYGENRGVSVFASVQNIDTSVDAPVDEDPLPLTDLGNARRLVRRHGYDLRYDHTSQKFYHFDGRRWAPDATGEVERRAKETVERIHEEALACQDIDRCSELLRWHKASQNKTKLRNMIELAKTEAEIAITADQFDRDQFLLNVENGTLNLRNGELQPHRREDLITMLAPVEYDPDAEAPLFNDFLHTIFDGNEAYISFALRFFGYALTGDTCEQAALVCHGSGANGKSTLLELFRAVMGSDYARQTAFDTFSVRKNNHVRNDIARLNGARLVTASEVEDGDHLAKSAFKQMTGGDTLLARYLFQEHGEFVPQMKLVFALNDFPSVDAADDALWRRLLVLPFRVTIPEEQQDKKLKEKMLEHEASGILNCLLEACLGWQRDGLMVPEEIQQATAQYRQEMDPLVDFISECCVLEPDAVVASRDLYVAYNMWARQQGETPVSKTRLGKLLGKRGLERGRLKDASRAWRGIALR